jgi:hypothetical protein
MKASGIRDAVLWDIVYRAEAWLETEGDTDTAHRLLEHVATSIRTLYQSEPEPSNSHLSGRVNGYLPTRHPGALFQCATCQTSITFAQKRLSMARADGAQPACQDCVTLELTRERRKALANTLAGSLPRNACDCITSGNVEKPKQHGADSHAKNCAIYATFDMAHGLRQSQDEQE